MPLKNLYTISFPPHNVHAVLQLSLTLHLLTVLPQSEEVDLFFWDIPFPQAQKYGLNFRKALQEGPQLNCTCLLLCNGDLKFIISVQTALTQCNMLASNSEQSSEKEKEMRFLTRFFFRQNISPEFLLQGFPRRSFSTIPFISF